MVGDGRIVAVFVEVGTTCGHTVRFTAASSRQADASSGYARESQSFRAVLSPRSTERSTPRLRKWAPGEVLGAIGLGRATAEFQKRTLQCQLVVLLIRA